MGEPIVNIKQGQLKGVTDTDLNDKTYYKFSGIPYAKPPVGSLRFKAPQPAESWTGVLDASKEGNPCLAVDLITQKVVGSEDCLYLNISTRELPKKGVSLKPVMVFIHGGAFTMGSASELFLGGKYLLAEDVVYVSINYRLGVFGFLSSDDLSLNVPGNAGLKDQTFALKWVQENISSFNGDPKNVTIFGVSAGGASVHFQVLTPTAKGLFHKAIAQSGVALNPWAWGQKNVIQVVEQLGHKKKNEKDALEILMKADATELYNATLKISDVLLNGSKRRPFGPVIEKPNPTAFLTENPIDLLKSGKFNQVPQILGFTSNEGLLYELGPTFLDVKPKETVVLWSFGIDQDEQKQAAIKAKFNDLYFQAGESREAQQEIVGDVCFTVGIIEAAKLTAKTSKSPVYFYVFSYETAAANGIFTLFGIDTKNFKGVSHGGDQTFLFNTNIPGVSEGLDPKVLEEQLIGVKKVTKIWTDFAKTSRPHEQWQPISDENDLKYFDINQDPKLKVNPFPERVAAWEEVLKTVSSDALLNEKPTL